MIVFFGDHRPWLGEQSVTYAALGIDPDAPGESGATATYLTDYLIWANGAAKKTRGRPCCGEGSTISPCFLMNELFRQCNWEGPTYLKLTNAVMERTPVVSTHDWYGTLGMLAVGGRWTMRRRRPSSRCSACNTILHGRKNGQRREKTVDFPQISAIIRSAG